MILVLRDVNGNDVEISDDELANILDTCNLEYEGDNDVDTFIDWVRYECEDSEEYNEVEYPIKCNCGCSKTECYDETYQNHQQIEYKIKCSGCGKHLGTWSYGCWSF